MPQIFNVGAPSRLVTATAWGVILLVLGAAAWLLLPRGVAPAWPASVAAQSAADLPWLVGAAAALLLGTLASAVGLLVRLDWARRSFIALLALAIAVGSATLWVQYELVQAQGLLATLVVCISCGWLMRCLMSPSVRQEFA